jgi:hypothetical protein
MVVAAGWIEVPLGCAGAAERVDPFRLLCSAFVFVEK